MSRANHETSSGTAITVPFRRELHRTVSHHKPPNGRDNGNHAEGASAPVNELTGLLNGVRDNRSWLRKVLLDRKKTPGMNSDKRVTRWVAEAWHILKVTLLSSMWSPPRMPTEDL
jgi:hypothetical protein